MKRPPVRYRLLEAVALLLFVAGIAWLLVCRPFADPRWHVQDFRPLGDLVFYNEKLDIYLHAGKDRIPPDVLIEALANDEPRRLTLRR